MHLSSADMTTVTVSLQDFTEFIRKLQMMQNAAAQNKVIDHIIPVLRSLHWLPVCQRIDIKILRLVCQALNGFEPINISDLLLSYEPPRPLRLSGTSLLSVPRIKTRHGEAVFRYYAPHIWNKLPETAGPLQLSPLLNQD